MSKPGDLVRKEPEYTSQPEGQRKHWENGDNGELTDSQKEKLKKKADAAAKYDRATKGSSPDYPRKSDGSIDHGALVRNAKQYVDDALQPDRDIRGNPAPRRSLGDIVDTCSSPQKPVDPSPDPADPDWVCTQHARFLAGILRALGYPVREVTVGLSQGGDYTYQESAIQVWFEGKWHFVDAYLCLYDPADILGPYSDYTDFKAYYWDGTTTPPEHPAKPDPDSGWKPLTDPGNDLHKRFYPSETDETGKDTSSKKLYTGRVPGVYHRRVASLVARAEGMRSGIVISTPTKDVILYLIDAKGGVTDNQRNEIPGAIRMPAGTPFGFMHEQPALTEEGIKPTLEQMAKVTHKEWVFFGTRNLTATWKEIGTHNLTLMVVSSQHNKVTLEKKILIGDNPISVSSIPQHIEIQNGVAALPFTVIIDPIDPTFHVIFTLLLKNGIVTPDHYHPANDSLNALLKRYNAQKNC